MARRLAVLLALQGAWWSASALRRKTPWPRSSAGDVESEEFHDGSFAVRVDEKADPVSVPWLKTAWIRSEQDRLSLKYPSLRSREAGVVNNFTIHNAGGMFAGIEAFNKALTKDLDAQLAKDLANCPLETMGGRSPTDFVWTRGDIPAGRVWIFVNGETSMGYQFWDEVLPFIMPGDKGVIIGNWWNETHESYDSDQVSSIWIPFASTSFAERKYHTPMDLWNRTRQTRFDHERKHLVAYQQTGCNDEREKFWDALNYVLRTQMNTTGSSIGKCNGHMELGERISLPAGFLDGPYPFSGHMDSSVGRYENFRFVFASEHGLNFHGYITEKISNAFLSGAVPIYMGAMPEQLEQVFEPSSFIQTSVRDEGVLMGSMGQILAAVQNEDVYRRLLHRSKPVVTAESMRRFFSWHPDVWPHFGDGLRQRILRLALRMCRAPARDAKH